MTIAVPVRTRPSPVDAFAKRLLLKAASRLAEGRLMVALPDGSMAAFGSSTGPSATLRVLSDRFFSRVLLHGEIGFGEAYMDGLWSTDDLTGLLEFALRNRGQAAEGKAFLWLAALSRLRNRRRHVARRNTRANSRRNIHDHYDLGNDFFRLFLDETMTYSCAVFEHDAQPLAEAQRNKYRLLCERAQLTQGDRVLEIGSGWGGFAMEAARRYGCQVTALSVSQQQVALAQERVRSVGLQGKVDVRLCDYRDVVGQFDKIVSIEMFEAVGAEYFETFFQCCDRLLRPGGLLGMQVITVPDRSFPAQRDGVNWLQKHIFPGGVLPSLAAMERAMARTGLQVTHVEEIGTRHYPATLRQWRERFFANVDAVRALGFDGRFIRKWEYYLCSCEAAFRTHTIGDVHLVARKG